MTVRIDVCVDVERARGEDVVVLVEPLYGAVAVTAALDAGWTSVELAPEMPDAPPIPLVSFEQPPVGDATQSCRVRATDLDAAALDAVAVPRLVLLGTPANARPLCAKLAMLALPGIAFVPVPSIPPGAEEPGAERVAADAWWASGMLIRILLEELDGRDAQLTDAAGMSVTVARGAENAAAQLGSGLRWARHLARGGHADDLRIAASIDSLGVVPRLDRAGDVVRATMWDGVAYSGS